MEEAGGHCTGAGAGSGRWETKISLTGSGEAVIENYKGILQYTDSEILLQSLRGKVLLRGRNLEIVWYTSLEMKITGAISSILLQQK